MKTIDQYPQTVLWSAEDNAYVGYCPAIFVGGGVCHGDDPVEVLRQVRELVEEEVERLRSEGRPQPPAAQITGSRGDGGCARRLSGCASDERPWPPESALLIRETVLVRRGVFGIG